MRTSITLTAALASALFAAAPFAHAGSAPVTAGTVAPMQAQAAPAADNVANYYPVIRLHCVANGSPSEFPNDILFTNRGSKLNAGTQLHWRFNAPNISGTYTLTAALAGGASVRASNVVPGGVEAGKFCSVLVK